MFFFRHILHQLPKLSCPHCSSTCTYSHHLKRHINEVHNPKRFQCPEYGCDLAFKRMTTLTQHQRIHLKNKPFQCKWCNFLGEGNLSLGSDLLILLLLSPSATDDKLKFQFAYKSKFWQILALLLKVLYSEILLLGCPLSLSLSGVQQNNIRSHALTTHPKEFRSAQENREKYWSGTGSGTGSANGVRTRPSPDSCSVPPK